MPTERCGAESDLAKVSTKTPNMPASAHEKKGALRGALRRDSIVERYRLVVSSALRSPNQPLLDPLSRPALDTKTVEWRSALTASGSRPALLIERGALGIDLDQTLRRPRAMDAWPPRDPSGSLIRRALRPMTSRKTAPSLCLRWSTGQEPYPV